MKEVKEVLVFFLDGFRLAVISALLVMGIILCVDATHTTRYPLAKVGLAIVCISLFLLSVKYFLNKKQ